MSILIITTIILILKAVAWVFADPDPAVTFGQYEVYLNYDFYEY